MWMVAGGLILKGKHPTKNCDLQLDGLQFNSQNIYFCDKYVITICLKFRGPGRQTLKGLRVYRFKVYKAVGIVKLKARYL